MTAPVCAPVAVRFLARDGEVHIDDADLPLTSLCGWGFWENNRVGTPAELVPCAACANVLDFEGRLPLEMRHWLDTPFTPTP